MATNKHPFKVGESYTNKIGTYEVLEIDDQAQKLHVRYDDGQTAELGIALQQRIWVRLETDKEILAQQQKAALDKAARKRKPAKSRARKTSAKAAPPPSPKQAFEGFTEGHFQDETADKSWQHAKSLGGQVVRHIGKGANAKFNVWAMPDGNAVYIAMPERFDPQDAEKSARFYIALSEDGLDCGLYIGKPDHKPGSAWNWSNLLRTLHDETMIGSLLLHMQSHDIRIYANLKRNSKLQTERHYAARPPLGFFDEQEQPVSVDDFIQWLEQLPVDAQCDLYIRQRKVPAQAIEQGAAVGEGIGDVLQGLLRFYMAVSYTLHLA